MVWRGTVSKLVAGSNRTRAESAAMVAPIRRILGCGGSQPTVLAV